MPTESLTLQITGDSSPLRRELDAVEQRLTQFQQKLAAATDVGRSLDNIGARFNELFRPLEQVSRLLDRIGGQLRTLAQIPVRLNVAPALQGLQAISQQIDAIAAKLNALAAPRPFIPAPLPLPQDPGPIRRFAHGGYVTGPAGLDRIPALLSAGEFVLKESAVRQLGTTFLQQLNQGAPAPAATSAPQPAINNSTVTNVGGIAVHVTRAAEITTLLRDLQYNDFRLRNRRG